MKLDDAMEKARANGHTLPDAPEQAGPFGSVTRWSCTVCLRSVLIAGSNVYGLAITVSCPGDDA